MFGACVVQDKSRFEVIETIEHDIDVGDVVFDVGGIHIVDFCLNIDRGIDTPKFCFRRDRLREVFLEIVLVEQRLPLQVREFNKVAVDDSQKPNTGTHDLIRHNGAERAEPYEKNAR
jgi:hypothetical protein